MSLNPFDYNIKLLADKYLIEIENLFSEDKADVLFYFGYIAKLFETKFRIVVEAFYQRLYITYTNFIHTRLYI